MRNLCVCLALVLCQASAFANQDVSAKIHYAGLFLLDEQHYDLQSVKQTTEIPAVLGQVFGIFLSIEHTLGREVVKIRQVIKNPSSEDVESLYFNDGAADFLAFGFDDPEELVEGEWVFELWHEDQKLAAQHFNVSKSYQVPAPEHDGAVASVCEMKRKTGTIRKIKVCVPPKP